LREAFGILLAIARPGHALDLQLHQAMGRKADHLAQQIRVRALLDQRPQVHHLIGHRYFLESGWCQQPDPIGESSMTTAKPPARYGAIEGARAGSFALSSYTISWDTTRRTRKNSLPNDHSVIARRLREDMFPLA
jgi:hypothetical protein